MKRESNWPIAAFVVVWLLALVGVAAFWSFIGWAVFTLVEHLVHG